MIFSRLSPAHYLDAQIFEQERQRLFGRLWLFACFRSVLAEPQTFATRELAGVPVLLQNVEGEIRAFENLCPHRQMPLQRAEFGQAKMVCPYHGWVFDGDGKVKTIPHEKTLYAYSADQRESLCLRRFAVRVVGNLVFVNLADQPLPFDAQFSPELQRELVEVSSHFGAQAIHANLPANYNWKLNFENVMDYNHVAYIHPKSFQPLLKAGLADQGNSKQDEPVRTTQTASVQLQQLSFQASSPIRLETQHWHEAVECYGDGGEYHNFFLYPNVNFISLGGRIFLVQQFHPLASGRTEVRFTLCAAREKRRLAGLPAILWGHLKSEVSVLQEDLVHLEALQARLHTGAPRAQHGIYEDRLMNVADIYLRLLAGEM